MKSEPVSTESPIPDSAVGVNDANDPDVSKMSNDSSLNSHLIQLLLYYRCLLRHSFRHCISNELQMKLERTLFNNLEQHFQSLLMSDGDSIRQFSSLPSNHIFLSSKGYISIQRLDQLFESFVNSTPKTTNELQTKQNSTKLNKLLPSRTSSAPAEIFDNDSNVVKDNNCQNYSKKHRASLDEQSLASKKLKKSSSTSKRNSSSLSSSSDSSSESDNTVVDQDFKISSSKKRSKKVTDVNGVEVDSTKGEETSSNRTETLNGTPESSSALGRPRRSCTLKSQPIYSSVPLSVLKKNAQTYSSTKKAKKIENVENRQSQSSSRASTSSSQNSQTVEELVVNCDPFNLIDSVGNSTATHNGRIYITNSNSGPNVPQQQQPQTARINLTGPRPNISQQTVRINLTGPKPNVPATHPPTIGNSYVFNNGSTITAIPISRPSLSTSAAPSTSAPNFARFNSKLPPTLSVVNNPMAGKSLGKILLINSKPFFIQNGNNISLPMINQNQTNVSAVVNQFTTAINAASTVSNNNNNNNNNNKSPKTFATIPAHSSKPIQAIVKPAPKPAVKIEIESDPEEDCKDNVRKEIERLKTCAANNNNNNSSVPKQKLLKTAVQPPPPQPPQSASSSQLPLTVRFVNKPSNISSYSNSPNLVQTNQSSSSSDLLRRTKQISNSKEPATISSGAGSSFILTSAKDQIEKSKQTRLNSMFEALAKAKAAKKTQELLSLQKSKEAAAIVTATISLCSPPKSSTQASSSASASSSSSSSAATTNSTLAKSYPCNLKPYSERIAKKTELIDQLKLRSHRQTRDPIDRKLTVYRNNTTDAIIGYKCNYEDCAGFLTARRDKVLAHIRTRHGSTSSSGGGSTSANSNSKSLVCDLCSKKFSKPEYLTLHRKIGHLDSATSSSTTAATSTITTTTTSAISSTTLAQGPFRCTTPGCDKQFNYRKSLHNHIANHFYEKPFVCNQSYCTERFIYSFQLKEHQRTEHGLIVETNGGGGDSQTKSSVQQSSNEKI